MAVIAALGTGLVIVSGCGQMHYSSTATPAANTTVIERIQTPGHTRSIQEPITLK